MSWYWVGYFLGFATCANLAALVAVLYLTMGVRRAGRRLQDLPLVKSVSLKGPIDESQVF